MTNVELIGTTLLKDRLKCEQSRSQNLSERPATPFTSKQKSKKTSHSQPHTHRWIDVKRLHRRLWTHRIPHQKGPSRLLQSFCLTDLTGKYTVQARLTTPCV